MYLERRVGSVTKTNNHSKLKTKLFENWKPFKLMLRGRFTSALCYSFMRPLVLPFFSFAITHRILCEKIGQFGSSSATFNIDRFQSKCINFGLPSLNFELWTSKISKISTDVDLSYLGKGLILVRAPYCTLFEYTC